MKKDEGKFLRICAILFQLQQVQIEMMLQYLAMLEPSLHLYKLNNVPTVTLIFLHISNSARSAGNLYQLKANKSKIDGCIIESENRIIVLCFTKFR